MSAAALPPASHRSLLARAAGWILLAVLLAFAGLVHHGIGPAPPGIEPAWYAPRRFFLDHDWSAALLDPPWLAVLTLGGAAALLAIGVWLGTRSAVARVLALSAVAAVLLFVFYGLLAPFPWEFFGWRGSAVLLLVSLCFGIAAGAPALAGSWLRWRWPLRLALYLPFAVIAIAFLCNATGTDPSLRFALSPWPAVPVFGMEVGVLLAAIVWIGTAAGLAGLAEGVRPTLRAARAVAAGVGLPLALLCVGSALGLFPFRVGASLLLLVALASGTAIAVAAAPATLRLAHTSRPARARRIAVGAALLAIPLLFGQGLVHLDYTVTREIRARRVIEALERYYAEESLYPDELDALVAGGQLDEIPSPAIGIGFGFGFGGGDGDREGGPGAEEGFLYQGFGTSYLLEFTATRWVQCAYTPAPVYEEDELLEEDFEAEELEESWSCPSRPPELW